jgi:hypothetical protein
MLVCNMYHHIHVLITIRQLPQTFIRVGMAERLPSRHLYRYRQYGFHHPEHKQILLMGVRSFRSAAGRHMEQHNASLR